ncbi:MAG: single-stranded DNA-binding protein [Prosthecobacter sp.]|uniref:single-stranded DNA-binding protein n=1 Tax=Prosthecobacter sp. TaxID=1965333 RepID=UPI003BB09E82
MRDLNQATFTGHLSSDVRKFETHDLKNGAEFTLAVNDEWRDNDGQLQKRTDYIGVICYGHLTATALLLRKGDSVLATGKMRNEDVPAAGGKSERKTKLRALLLATHREIKPA